jgi:Glycosyltransferase Family 4
MALTSSERERRWPIVCCLARDGFAFARQTPLACCHNRRMHIAQVAPLAESVPPEGYAGTERVVSYLTEELGRLGHEVTLFATADSEPSGNVEPMSPHAARSDPEMDTGPFETRMLIEAYRRSDEFDIIHCRTDYVGLPLAEQVSTPTVITLHGGSTFRVCVLSFVNFPTSPTFRSAIVSAPRLGHTAQDCRQGRSQGSGILRSRGQAASRRPSRRLPRRVLW